MNVSSISFARRHCSAVKIAADSEREEGDWNPSGRAKTLKKISRVTGISPSAYQPSARRV
jgi:hypothetical protein